jgi:3-oxoacyl-[acyl-carrier-protein] synthase III
MNCQDSGMDATINNRLGISAIAVHEPAWALGNDWFAGTIPRKFTHHTGIESRLVSTDDEVTLGLRAVRKLQSEVGCDLNDCAALVFVSPSFVPMRTAIKHLGPDQARSERLRHAARQLTRRLGMSSCRVTGLNWFCSGYSRAMELVTHRLNPRLDLTDEQFVLIVTASRISRITDYACKQTAGLFGDLATATLVARSTSRKYPAHFELLHASAARQPADGVFFDFQLRDNVLTPDEDSGQRRDAQRLVFSLDGMGIADIAPRAMANALAGALAATGTEKSDLRFILPHQAGAGIVRLTAMKVEQLGIGGEVVNGLTSRVGNVSSGSIPYGLKHHWSKFTGLIGCPTAAVGAPGAAEVSQGCLLLRSTPLHDRLARTAA